MRSRNKQKFFEVKESRNVMQNIFKMPEVLISRPTNIEYEKYVFQEYMDVIQIIQTEFNKKSSLDDDREIFNKPNLSWMYKMAVLYRIKLKKIIQSHITLISKVLQVLSEM